MWEGKKGHNNEWSDKHFISRIKKKQIVKGPLFK